MSQTRKPGVPLTALAAALTLTLGTAVAQSQPDRSPGAQSQPSSPQQSTSRQSGGLQAIAAEHRELSTFIEAVEAVGLESSLTAGTHYTIFAPTNEAFEKLRKDKDELLSADNREDLTELIRSHIVADDVDPARAQQLREARTLDGGSVDLSSKDGQLMVGDATVVASNIQQGNLRIYAIDEVLDSRADRNVLGGGDRSRANDDDRARSRSGAALGEPRDRDDAGVNRERAGDIGLGAGGRDRDER